MARKMTREISIENHSYCKGANCDSNNKNHFDSIVILTFRAFVNENS